jgi:putative transposase
MSTWLSARELSGLPGFEMSERATLDKLKRLQVPHRSRNSRGGGREFDCAALPAETRQALMLSQVAAAVPVIAAQAEASSLPATTQPVADNKVPALVTTERKPPSQSEKAVADARAVLVRHLQDMAQVHGSTRAGQILALELAAERASPELMAVAKTANQRARKHAPISERTLQRWTALFKADGWWGLLPAATEPTTGAELGQDVAAVLGLFLSRDPMYRNLSAAAKEVARKMGNGLEGWKPLYHRAQRALPSVDKVALIKSRHSGAERAAKLPFKRRDTSVIKPLDVWLIDGHTFKAKVRHPDHGAPFAPEVTICIDAATRMVTGWSVALSENVMAVGDALRHGVGNCGVPAIIYSDNGSGETAKQMDCPVAGIVARLGSDHRTGIPGHPQGHGLIERSWRTHMINCARQFASYQGKDVDSLTFRKVAGHLASEQRAVRRASETGGVIQLSNKAPSWQQFIDAIERSVNEYNQEHRHRSLPKNAQGKHMTPAEAWAAMVDPQDQHIPSPQELRMLFMPAMLRQAKRGEVQFLNQVYFAPELMQVDGQQVRVHYDIHDPHYVLVFNSAGEFVCEAKWNANRMDYFPKPVVEMAREKRVRGIVKRREAQIDTAMRELQGAPLQPTPVSLPAPSTPVVLVPTVSTAVPLSSLVDKRPSDAVAEVAQAIPGRPFFDTQSDRYEWLMQHRARWADGDAAWVAGYVGSDDYAELREYFTSRGIDWSEGEAGFKSAR